MRLLRVNNWTRYFCHAIMNFSWSPGQASLLWNTEQPKFEDKDAILAANVGGSVKKRPAIAKLFNFHPLIPASPV